MTAPYPDPPILMIDDDSDWLNLFEMLLNLNAGINNVVKCLDSRDAMQLIAQQSFSLILLDLTMPHVSGEELLEQLSETYPELPVVIVSGANQIDTAIRCIKKGAEDFIVKTDDLKVVVAVIHRVLKKWQLQQVNSKLARMYLEQTSSFPPAFAALVTNSPQMHNIFKYLQAISSSNEPVLISGESGVGKELIARAIHQLTGSEIPWVAVNVAGLDDVVFSDTLFGHLKGAYTGASHHRPGMIEQAQGGILFLDEIGDLSIASQVKLLRLLQEGEYYPLGADKPQKMRARIVVATNHDLTKKEAAGEFRRDLLYRLWAHRIEIPPLRERPEDIGPLLHHFLDEAARKLNKKKPTPPQELESWLASYSFPGNVRELRAMIYNAVSVHNKGVLSMDTFQETMGLNSAQIDPNIVDVKAQDQGQVIFTEKLPTIKQVCQLLVDEAMERAKNNQTHAAKLLGISPQALGKRLKKKS